MTEAVQTPAAPAAPAAAPAAPTPAPAAPAVQDSLFSPTPPAAPTADPAAPAAPADEHAWLPEKYRVMGADGQLDLAASSKKLGEGYSAAVKKIGTGDTAPPTPEEYKFTPPEQFKDVPLDEGLSKSFRERAHKAGLTNSQFEFVMGEYFNLVPALLDGKAAATAAEARSELQKVWATPSDLDRNMSAAERAVALTPESLRDQIKEKYGADPLFWQFAAHYGRQLREDTPPGAPAPAAASSDVEALMKSEPYRNPKHPEHAAVSARVREAMEKRYGSAPAIG